jgi:glucosamine--fructose-6-phosphate aminotransferase (isomerizing)
MCGIVGYVGRRSAPEILLAGLARLEYRGYDSAGIAVALPDAGGALTIVKSPGKVAALRDKVSETRLPSGKLHAGIAHTRWATHGSPTEANAHPHASLSGRLAIVHNGIIENYAELKTKLQENGCRFLSETDSEVLAHLIAECYDGDLLSAVAAALKRVVGTFGLAAISADAPDEIVAARSGSPIVVGLGNGENIVSSDASAIVAHTREVVYLDDGDMALITADGVDFRTLENVPVAKETAKIDWDVGTVEKGGYEHFTLKEIHEQPEALRNAIRGRLDRNLGTALLSGLGFLPDDIPILPRVIFAACGTSMHAGMVGEYYVEELAGISAETAQAAEFRYRDPIIEPYSLVVAISQSGETADTLAAVREAKTKGALVAAICNVVGSTIARETGRGVYLHAGPEIGVASTKAFTCQTVALLMMALKFGRVTRLSPEKGRVIVDEIERIPELVEKVLEREEEIKDAAADFANASSCFFIGRGPLYPVALEGALKLKEISYIHAEGYHAAELKHGPIALLDENTPVVALANDIPGKDKMIGNIRECLARHAPVIAVATEGDDSVAAHADRVLRVPRSSRHAAPITTVVALQLLAYHVAKLKGREIDQPRNLAKSVTVE